MLSRRLSHSVNSFVFVSTRRGCFRHLHSTLHPANEFSIKEVESRPPEHGHHLQLSQVTVDSIKTLDVAAIAKKPYYVTTPIFYPNAAPHIGHLHSLVIADIYARHAKLADPNRPVLFVTGTDEHGLKIQKAAQEKGMDTQDFVDELSVHFRNLTKKANISNTHFTRTTSQQHVAAVQHLWKELEAKNYIYKGRHEGWYSISDETFVPDKQIVGDPREDPRLLWYSEENYMFRLSAFPGYVYEHYAARGDAIYPANQASDVRLMLKSMMQNRHPSSDDLSISRPRSRLSWGVPVPGDPEQTIYVWIDALAAYLTSVGYPWSSTGGDGIVAGWPPNLQVIGKDIIRFHTVYFPAMLQALGIPLPLQVLSHAHWTVEHAKMSKSVGNVADPIKAIDEFGIDLVRYYLARVGGRFQDDVDWSQAQLQRHSKEIISLLGNLFMRATSEMMMKKVSVVKPRTVSLVPESNGSQTLRQSMTSLASRFDAHIREFELMNAVEAVTSVLSEANQFMTQAAPWAKETSPTIAADVQVLVFEALRQAGILLQPIMPDTAALLLDSLGIAQDRRAIADATFGRDRVGEVRRGVRLFDVGSLKLKA